MSKADTGWALAALAVVVWRIAAYLSSGQGLETPWREALALLGLVFVAGGLVARRLLQIRATTLYALCALCSGLHWGGPIGSTNLSENPYWLPIYVVLSTVLGQTLLLHFALEFPERWPGLRRRWLDRLLYVPTWISALAAIATWTGPDGLRELALGIFAGLLFVTNLFSYVAVALLVVKSFRGSMRSRWASRLAAAGLIVGGVPPLLASLELGLGGSTDAYNLFYGLEAVGVVLACWRLRGST